MVESSSDLLLATDYSHETKPGTTAKTKEESVCVRRTRLGQVYERDLKYNDTTLLLIY